MGGSSGSREKRKILPCQHRLQASKDGEVLFAQGLRQREKPGKARCSRLATKPSRDFVLEFCSLDRPFRTIVVWGHIPIAHERKDPILMLGEALLESAFLLVDQRHRKQLA